MAALTPDCLSTTENDADFLYTPLFFTPLIEGAVLSYTTFTYVIFTVSPKVVRKVIIVFFDTDTLPV